MITSLEGKVKEEIEMAVNQRMSLKLEHSHACLLQEILSRESEGGTSTTCFRSRVIKKPIKEYWKQNCFFFSSCFLLKKALKVSFEKEKSSLRCFSE